MTSKAEWLALAERCEGATGSDRDIERCMGSLLPEGFQMIPYFGFTSSLDAITSLIEREMPDAGWSAHNEYYDVIEGRIMRRGQDTIMRYSATPALALCAAFCRAMAEKAE